MADETFPSAAQLREAMQVLSVEVKVRQGYEVLQQALETYTQAAGAYERVQAESARLTRDVETQQATLADRERQQTEQAEAARAAHEEQMQGYQQAEAQAMQQVKTAESQARTMQTQLDALRTMTQQTQAQAVQQVEQAAAVKREQLTDDVVHLQSEQWRLEAENDGLRQQQADILATIATLEHKRALVEERNLGVTEPLQEHSQVSEQTTTMGGRTIVERGGQQRPIREGA